MAFRSWEPDLREQVDALIGLEDSVAEGDMGWVDTRGISHARVHGNPNFDTATIAWHDSVEDKRAESGAYGSEDVLGYLDVMRRACRSAEGAYIFDIDDPELEKFGEDGIHERLTSHIAEVGKNPVAWPEEMAPVLSAMFQYFEDWFFTSLKHGTVPLGIITEIHRQWLGFPYEWTGARVNS
ncbi:hypothetical protein [Mycobacterium colombiense]|uniref:hypothetical protein n=1 Tax=Mycobacterium colombiense TaxID=339268 RepID=UPI0012DB22AD|nr:hypothetical protein [Mycobacterium colombiense]